MGFTARNDVLAAEARLFYLHHNYTMGECCFVRELNLYCARGLVVTSNEHGYVLFPHWNVLTSKHRYSPKYKVYPGRRAEASRKNIWNECRAQPQRRTRVGGVNGRRVSYFRNLPCDNATDIPRGATKEAIPKPCGAASSKYGNVHQSLSVPCVFFTSTSAIHGKTRQGRIMNIYNKVEL